ncbi:MAG: ubiquinone/menaquinone biosynthesis methyltransferase [Chloroflexi bacterium]|jgi:demethylmenaquinone methyltransferase/2-methoxy-6-polyprenyl-1,4-benzoquinol methylase|nr:ubiquinone/menaquinone biosynthesis methyltransferase [Chloroflexota bacterium]
MSNLTGTERSKYVQSMFTKIAHRYDLMNRLMTGGQDIRWRKQVIKLARLTPNAALLDLGTGTGDLAREALLQQPQAKVTAADFTIEMMRVGNKNGNLEWSAADALNLPFKNITFDAVVSGFLMRNVTDIQQALKEQYRTLKPGGRIVILDTTRPKKNLLSPFIWLHMHFIIPTIGGLLSGERDAYNYLPDTTENFLTAEQLAARMIAVGFKKVDFKRMMFGTIGIHWGEK